MSFAPMRCISDITCFAPINSITLLVARFELRTIMWRTRSSSGTSRPTRSYMSLSESSLASSEYGEPSKMLENWLRTCTG